MELKQSTIKEIIDSERNLMLDAPNRYGEFYTHAIDSTLFLSNFVKSADVSQQIFVRFVSQIKKHHTLALFSCVRLHKIQAMMNLRQALEATASAAYAIRNTDLAHFVDEDNQGLLIPSKELTKRRYNWLAANFPEGSKDIKDIKNDINEFAAHANLINTSANFELPESGDWASAPFFDIEDEHLVKTDLWLIGHISILITKLLYDVAQTQKHIVIIDDFHIRHSHLTSQSLALRDTMMATERYQRFDATRRERLVPKDIEPN